MKFILWAIICLFSSTTFAQESFINVGISAVDLKPVIGIPLASYGAKASRLQK